MHRGSPRCRGEIISLLNQSNHRRECRVKPVGGVFPTCFLNSIAQLPAHLLARFSASPLLRLSACPLDPPHLTPVHSPARYLPPRPFVNSPAITCLPAHLSTRPLRYLSPCSLLACARARLPSRLPVHFGATLRSNLATGVTARRPGREVDGSHPALLSSCCRLVARWAASFFSSSCPAMSKGSQTVLRGGT